MSKEVWRGRKPFCGRAVLPASMLSETPQPQGEDTGETSDVVPAPTLSPFKSLQPTCSSHFRQQVRRSHPLFLGLKHKDKSPGLVAWDPLLLLHLSLGVVRGG